jgi:hypothetical protein
MPGPEADYLDDGFGEDGHGDLETELEAPGTDALPNHSNQEELTMSAHPTGGSKDDRTHVKGGVRGDDDRAADRLSDKKERRAHQEELLDEGVEETFPASDPVSVKRIT